MTRADQQEQLENGLRVITRHMPDADSVTVQFFIAAGGRYEDLEHEYGVSHFLEHLLYKGSENYRTPQSISEALDGVGGYANAFTTAELTSFFAKVPSQHFELALDVLGDIVTAPLFDAQEIERERKVIMEEINVYRDDPAQHVFDFAQEVLWPHAALRSNILGTEDTVRDLPREVIKSYHAALYCPDNMVVAVAGNVTHHRAMQEIRNKLGHLQTRHSRQPFPTEGTITKHRAHIVHSDTNQTHLVLAGRAVPRRHPDEPALRVLTSLLGGGPSSRLFTKVREEKGLAYAIYMGTASYADAGNWDVYAGVNNASLSEALTAILVELARIRSEPVTPEELARVQQQLEGRIIMSQETNGAVADRMGSELLLAGNVQSIEHILGDVAAVTIEDVQRVAQQHLDPSNMRLALIAPAMSARVEDIEQLFYTN